MSTETFHEKLQRIFGEKTLSIRENGTRAAGSRAKRISRPPVLCRPPANPPICDRCICHTMKS